MIYITRHGQTDWNLTKRMQGRGDIPLNKDGIKEAHALAKQLVPLNIDKIISSDLIRAQKTAQIINSYLNVPLLMDNRLQEIDYGLIEGKLKKDITKDDWFLFNFDPSAIGAESFIDLYERVKSFFSDLFEKFENENLLIVTHGGLIRMMMHFIENPQKLDINVFEKTYKYLKIQNTELFYIDKDNNCIKTY